MKAANKSTEILQIKIYLLLFVGAYGQVRWFVVGRESIVPIRLILS